MKMIMSSLSECRGLGALFSLGERTKPGEGGLEREGIHLSVFPFPLLPSLLLPPFTVPDAMHGAGDRAASRTDAALPSGSFG